jgi:hypothetical protein
MNVMPGALPSFSLPLGGKEEEEEKEKGGER